MLMSTFGLVESGKKLKARVKISDQKNDLTYSMDSYVTPTILISTCVPLALGTLHNGICAR